MKKICNQCSKNKSFKEFYKDKSRKDGRSWFCIPCHLLRLKNKREKDPELDKINQKNIMKNIKRNA